MNLEPLDIKSDWRGTLVNAFDLPTDGTIFYVNATPGATRGNHYHKRKTEHFLVIAGSASMQVKDRDTGNLMKIETSGQRPMLISIHANHTHNITAGDDGCIFLVWCDEKYNEEDSDTYPEEV